jgi:hypothetical protein
MSDTPSLTPPPPEHDPLAPGPAPSAFERARLRKAALQARAEQVAKQAEAALSARLMVGSAVINATLWDRKVRGRLGESGSMPA